MLFGYFTLFVALTISAVAEFYSIVGLTAIFSAAFWPIVIMGGSLGVGKVTAAVWLKLNWHRANWTYKLYLVPAVAFLMVLTSMGIFGYLSKAHSDQSLVSGDAVAKVAIYDEKIKIERENIDANRKALKQLDEAVDQVMGRSTDEKGADKAVAIRRAQQKERGRLLAEITESQKRITTLNEERAPLAVEFRKVEAEVGPIKYIAAMVYGDNPDANILEKAVRLVIILIVAVFDPLALVLILAAQQSLRWAQEEKEQPVDDSKHWQERTDELLDVFKDEKTDLDPEPSLLDKHPYLTAPFAHFKNLKPMVATPVPKPEIYAGNPEDFKEPWPEEKKQELVNAMQEIFNKNKEDKILATGIDDIERPGDYLTPPTEDSVWKEAEITESHDDDTPEMKAAKARWKAEHPNDTLKHQRWLFDRGELSELPWMKFLQPVADNEPRSTSGFGIQFPSNPQKGDTFVRVDRLPSALYKFNGNTWIEVDKNLSDSYTYDAAYIDHLIAKIDSGEYDPDLLSDSEREQVTAKLQGSK